MPRKSPSPFDHESDLDASIMQSVLKSGNAGLHRQNESKPQNYGQRVSAAAHARNALPKDQRVRGKGWKPTRIV